MSSALAAASDREAALLQFTGSLASGDLEVLRRAIDSRSRLLTGPAPWSSPAPAWSCSPWPSWSSRRGS